MFCLKCEILNNLFKWGQKRLPQPRLRLNISREKCSLNKVIFQRRLIYLRKYFIWHLRGRLGPQYLVGKESDIFSLLSILLCTKWISKKKIFNIVCRKNVLRWKWTIKHIGNAIYICTISFHPSHWNLRRKSATVSISTMAKRKFVRQSIFMRPRLVAKDFSASWMLLMCQKDNRKQANTTHGHEKIAIWLHYWFVRIGVFRWEFACS